MLNQLADLGDVIARKMFGGVGLYCDGYFFGIIARDVLYLKVDARTRAAYEARGSQPFAPYPDRPGSTHYFAVPLDVLESGPELVQWAHDAVAVARRGEKSGSRAQVRRGKKESSTRPNLRRL